MPTCFVIQPFDGGKFDKRYQDTFKIAIENAGAEPYRVDEDPASSIPIQDIEDGIRSADIVFADITLDNPNVWFELGFAIALGKFICIICSDERSNKFPFDVQHRNIIRYKVESPSDYIELQDKITRRLRVLLEKSVASAVQTAVSPVVAIGNLSHHETVVLTAIIEEGDGLEDFPSHWTLRRHIERLGYNNLALRIGIEKLVRKGMVQSLGEIDDHNESHAVYEVTKEGMNWVLENESLLNLKVENAPNPQQKAKGLLDDDIPF
jgi:nucleoside 2-deoxyribosyltransferase